MIEKKKNSRKAYAIIVTVLIVIIAFAVFKSNNNAITDKKDITATIAETKEEKAIARIDISTKMVDETKPQFEVYVDDSENPEKQASWMNKYDSQGYVIQKEGNSVRIYVKAISDADIKILLRGPYKLDENKKAIPIWVEYTSLIVNGKEILQRTKPVWCRKAYKHFISAKAGDEITIDAKWKKYNKD